ncbi:hypothetical protein KDD17_04485 [Sulfitobacter albidus]|uniref:Uncharacterized protein n=1 Tax=Sulfitobacter albidus TaxID=2829501 RepID=A0A975JF28_9RHOB|nr:hypothetical protein [Sulfitobacter albidus]QUJ77278.1 hypothetical protein KDD17_04485 [Sulfitobacter albidus]
MPIKNLLAAASLITVLATSVAAKGTFYDCDMNVDVPNGWVSPKIGIVVDEAGKATVLDNIILTLLEKPLQVRARARGDSLRLSWQIAGAIDSAGQRVPTFSYQAWLDTKNLGLSVVAKPVGFPQRFSGKGRCQIRKNFNGFPRS